MAILPINGFQKIQSAGLKVGSITSLPYGSQPTVEITGTPPNQLLNVGIPAGKPGDNGSSPLLTIGKVTTLSAGSQATASISGTAPAFTLDIGIPAGPSGSNATTTATATTSANGLMSSADKTKLDTINAPVFNVIASGGRPVGTAFTVDANRNARVSYTISYTLTATLTVGQTLQIVATVDGKEVARMADGILLGLAGNLQRQNHSASMCLRVNRCCSLKPEHPALSPQ